MRRCKGCHLTPLSLIPKLAESDKEVKVRIRGWIKPGPRRILVKDNTGVIELPIENPRLFEGLPCESYVEIRGRAVDGRIYVDELTPLHIPRDGDYLCTWEDLPEPLEYVKQYPRYARHPTIMKLVKTHSAIAGAARAFLKGAGFLEIAAPIIGIVSDPGLRGASKVRVELYGNLYELQSSVIMYKQLYASVFERIFYVARNIRVEPLENISTGRHLVEFTQVDVESALTSSREMMRLGEQLIYSIVKELLDKSDGLIDGQRAEALEREIIKPPYPVLTYEEALEEASRLGHRVVRGKELSFEAEVAIASKFGSPVWIAGFPTGSRGFYYFEKAEGINDDFNLLLPRLGEVIDGGCREYRPERVVKRIGMHGEDLARYKWFLELLEAGGIMPTCGWGLGVERLTFYVTGAKHIAYATPHPRIPGVIGP